MPIIHLPGKSIGGNAPCFIIAEAGVNHVLVAADLQRINAASPRDVAYQMVDVASVAGADAIKFQSFTTEKLQYQGTKKPGYQVANVGTDEEVSYFELLKKLETSREDQIAIADYCRKKGIIFLSTPYDNESLAFLDRAINVPLFKLASIEVNNHLFIRKVAATGKPIILSTGLSTFEEVRAVVNIARSEGFANRLALLQCTSHYPTPPEEVNLNVLATYQKSFPDVLVGLSDHSEGFVASVGAAALGVAVLEKHFTLDKRFSGPDHVASLDPQQLRSWVSSVRELEASLGSPHKQLTAAEKNNLAMRKYLVVQPAPAGTIITEDALVAMRTGAGILPTDANLQRIIGRRLSRDVSAMTPLAWDLIDDALPENTGNE